MTSKHGALVLLGLSMILWGCGAFTKPACMVIDVAQAACAVITVPDGHGGTETVRVSRDELIDTVRVVKATRSGHFDRPDAGR